MKNNQSFDDFIKAKRFAGGCAKRFAGGTQKNFPTPGEKNFRYNNKYTIKICKNIKKLIKYNYLSCKR